MGAHPDTAIGAPVSDPAGIQKHPETRRIGDRRSALPVESGGSVKKPTLALTPALCPREREKRRTIRNHSQTGGSLPSAGKGNPLPMNLVAAEVRRLTPFRLKEVGASSRRLLRFMGLMREVVSGKSLLGRNDSVK